MSVVVYMLLCAIYNVQCAPKPLQVCMHSLQGWTEQFDFGQANLIMVYVYFGRGAVLRGRVGMPFEWLPFWRFLLCRSS